MATPQLSPGVLVREVDLTVGRADNVLDNIGGIAGPFPIGPVDDPIDITTEQELISVFGKPKTTDSQNDYWLSAASYLSYGGVLKVVRTSGTTLQNANAGVGLGSTSMTGSNAILNYDDYINNHSSATNFNYAAKNPGSWANNLKVCVIDDKADQTIGITTNSLALAGATIGYAVTAYLTNQVIPGTGTTSLFSGFIKGIITGVTTDSTDSASTIDVKIVERVTAAGVKTAITYEEGAAWASFSTSNSVRFLNNSGVVTESSAVNAFTPASAVDWYDEQQLGLTNAVVYWKEIAPKPTTNQYVLDRNGLNDALHVCIVDDMGTVTGIQGNILEKHVSLSKALDTVSSVNSPQKIWYEQFLADFSNEVYAGGNPSSAADTYWGTDPVATGFSTDCTRVTTSEGLWGQNAQGITFSALGNVTYTLTAGTDYSSSNGFAATLGDLITSYGKLSNKDEVAMDYFIMGPGLTNVNDSQAKAGYLLSLANSRKDCVACVGPHKADLVGVTNTTTQTNNLVNYFSTLMSTSYGVFDSGMKYTYDRFNKILLHILGSHLQDSNAVLLTMLLN